jgi:hypothetical protein
MRTEEEFKKQVEVKEITFWPHHDCSICGYVCGYHFKNGHVGYDNGCYCTGRSYGENITSRTWSDLAEAYNIQTHPEVISEMDEFWGFEKASA